MDLLTFASKTIDALAWPLASVLLVMLLRGEIRELAPLIKKIKAGPLEAEFDREVKEVKVNTAESSRQHRVKSPDVAAKALLLQLADLHPRSAILEAWVRVEAAARAVLAREQLQSEMSGYLPAARLAEPLAQIKVLDQGQVTLFHELRRLRNDVAHSVGLEPSPNAVMSYIEMASYLQSWMEEGAR